MPCGEYSTGTWLQLLQVADRHMKPASRLIQLLIESACLVDAQHDVFIINRVNFEAFPPSPLPNGAKLELRCIVEIVKLGAFQLNHKFSFYKDDQLIYSNTSLRENETYTIYPARVSNSGTYKCQVDVESKTGSKELEVRITGVSKPILTVSKTEVKEREQVSMVCEAPEEEPPLLFTFYKIKLGKQAFKSRSSPDKKSAQAVFEIEEGDSILHFQCDVKVISVPNEDKSALSDPRIVTVTEPFSTPRIEVIPSLNFTEGRNLSIKCSVQTPPSMTENVEITIQKDKQILNSSVNNYVLFSQLATVQHMGNYTCKAELGKAWKISSVYVTVAELFSRPDLYVNVTDSNINEEDILSLTCVVPGLSQEDSNNQTFYLLRNKGARKQMNIGGKYSMAVKERDTGAYVCEVTISSITKTSVPVNVKVHAPVSKPVLTQHTSSHRMVVLGDMLDLMCVSHNGTFPINYTLYRGDEQLSKVVMSIKSPAIFKVNVTKPHDLVMYRCKASNKNTRIQFQFSDTINITVITPVRGTVLLTIPGTGTVEEGEPLDLVCSVENGTFPIEFKFYVKKGKEATLLNVTNTYKNHTYYTVSSFNKDKDGMYYCTASNRARQNIKSNPVAVKAVLANWKKGIIISFVVFIIVAVISISLYFYLDKKRKGREIALNMTRTHNITGLNNEKSDMELKNEDLYTGSTLTEDENHVLKNSEENIGNNQNHNEVEYTEVEVDTVDPHRAPVTKKMDTVYSEITRSNHDADENNANEQETTSKRFSGSLLRNLEVVCSDFLLCGFE
ncbi:platelet endothelial cell adhesion molecule-like [Pelodytes ibericus]